MARVAYRRASLGRPRSSAASAAITRVTRGPSSTFTQHGRSGLAGTGDVARPPAGLGEIHEAVVIEGVAPGQRLELGARERERPETQVHVGQDELRGPLGRPEHGAGLGPRRRARGRRRSGAKPSARRSSSPDDRLVRRRADRRAAVRVAGRSRSSMGPPSSRQPQVPLQPAQVAGRRDHGHPQRHRPSTRSPATPDDRRPR